MDPVDAALALLADAVVEGIKQGISDAVEYYVASALGVPGGNNLANVETQLHIINEKLDQILSALGALRVYIDEDMKHNIRDMCSAIAGFTSKSILNAIETAPQGPPSVALITQLTSYDAGMMGSAGALIGKASNYGYAAYLSVISAATSHIAVLQFLDLEEEVPAFAADMVAYCDAALNPENPNSLGHAYAVAKLLHENNANTWSARCNWWFRVEKDLAPGTGGRRYRMNAGPWPIERGKYPNQASREENDQADISNEPYLPEMQADQAMHGQGVLQTFLDNLFENWRLAGVQNQKIVEALDPHVAILRTAKAGFERIVNLELNFAGRMKRRQRVCSDGTSMAL